MDIEDEAHIHTGIFFSCKKKTNPTICNYMDGGRGYYAQWISQVEKDKHQMISLICGVWQRSKSEGTKQQQTHRTQEGTKGYWRGGVREGGWGEREKGIEGVLWLVHMVCVGSQGRQRSTEKTSSDSVASYYADGQWLQCMGGTW